DRDNGLAIGIELDRVAALVPIGDRLAKTGNPLGYRVSVRLGASRRLHQFVDDVLRGIAIGVTHRHIDDILAPTPGRHFELARDVENIGRKPVDTRKLPHGGSSGAGTWENPII